MILQNESLKGEYRHIRFNRSLIVKKITGPYAIIEYEKEKEVVISKEILFDNYNQVKKEE